MMFAKSPRALTRVAEGATGVEKNGRANKGDCRPGWES